MTLDIQNLSSGYQNKIVLDGLDLKVDSAGIVAIVGPNGSGKTTILKSIFNQCDIYSGKVSVDGENITNAPTYELVRKHISYVPQGRHVFEDLTVKENLEMGAFCLKNGKVAKKKIKGVLEQFDYLYQKMNDCAFKLSGGQQQVLSIAIALVQEPALLLLDEPSLGLSPKMVSVIFKIIQEINKVGITIVLVEQNVKQAIEIADKTYVLRNGRVVLETDKSILSGNRLRDLYFGNECS